MSRIVDRRPLLSIALAAALCAWTAGRAGAQTLDVPGTYATIQEAIDGAPEDAVVQIAPGTYRERLEIQARAPGLTLRGDPDDPSRVVIDAGGGGATLRVRDVGDNLLVEGITFTGGTGWEGHGGGLYLARSAATFRRCVFRNNAVPNDGGGAYVLESSGLFQDCEFRDNTAGSGAGLLVHQDSTTVFDACRFVGNRASNGSATGVGGGFYVSNSSPTFLDCLVQGNHATGAGGGGVILSPDWDAPERETLIRGCLVAENVVDEFPGSLRQGGGLHVEDNVRVRIVDSVIRANVATSGGGLAEYRAVCELENTLVEDNEAVLGADGTGGHGGGIFVQAVNATPPNRRAPTMVLAGSVVRRNVGRVGGGIFSQGDFVGGGDRATLVVEDSLIADNTAAEQGGGIQADRTVASVRRSHLLRNRAGVYGGGITSVFGSSLEVTDATLAGNVSDALGGAIFCDRGGTLAVSGARITGNRAGSTPAQAGGAIAIGEAEGPTPGPVNGQVTGSVIADNGANFELWETDCQHTYPSAVTFVDNTLHSSAGLLYKRYCGPSIASVSELNALAGKASGNRDALPDFVSFLAAPAAIPSGGTSVLSWVAPGAPSLAVAPGPGSVDAPLGTADVTPATTTTYALDGAGISPASATVRVACPELGIAIAREPTNGGLAAPGDTRLRWFAAGGASTYDVYLDRDGAPLTLVADEVADTGVSVTGLAPGAAYRWRVVAKSPTCDTPVSSPVFTFTTCASDPCVTHDFGSRDAADWRVIGRGKIRVVDGMLEIRGTPRVRAFAPGAGIGAGRVEVVVVPWRGRRVSVYTGYLDDGDNVEVAVKGRGGWRLFERRGGKKTLLAKARHPIASKQRVAVRLDVGASEVVVSADGTEVMRGTLSQVVPGPFGVGTRRATVRIDDVRIAGSVP